MTQPMLAERVGVSVPTIGKLEDGDPSTSLATMLRVLSALGLAADIDLLAAQDTRGRSLQDSELKRAMPKRVKKNALQPQKIPDAEASLAPIAASVGSAPAGNLPSTRSRFGWATPVWEPALWSEISIELPARPATRCAFITPKLG